MTPSVNSQTPQSHFTSLTKALKKLALTGDPATFRAFLHGRFREQIIHVEPAKVEFALAAVQRAKCEIEARTRLPAKPKPCTAKGAKLDWAGNPALRARLASLYAKHGADNHRAVAASMRITVGQARLAKRRHLDPGPKHPLQKAA